MVDRYGWGRRAKTAVVHRKLISMAVGFMRGVVALLAA
jgi:hypothetical protein